MTKYLLFLSFMLYFQSVLYAQKVPVHTTPANFSVEKEAAKLAELINHYRLNKKLGELQVSPSLSYVAYTHLQDVYKSNPAKTGCLLTSWSNKGKWKPCCFKNIVDNTDLMTSKPSELTGFKGKGYEIIISGIENKSMVDLLDFWIRKKATTDFLLSSGKWESKSWQSMGVSIYKGYASVWFSEIPDRFASLSIKNDPKKGVAAADVKGDSRRIVKPVVVENSSKMFTSAKTSSVDSARIRNIKNSKPDVPVRIEESNLLAKTKTEPNNFKNYYLVHSTYSTLNEAVKSMAFLKKTGIKRLILLDANGKYRVVLGIYPEKELAESAIEKLKFRFDKLSVFSF